MFAHVVSEPLSGGCGRGGYSFRMKTPFVCIIGPSDAFIDANHSQVHYPLGMIST